MCVCVCVCVCVCMCLCVCVLVKCFLFNHDLNNYIQEANFFFELIQFCFPICFSNLFSSCFLTPSLVKPMLPCVE